MYRVHVPPPTSEQLADELEMTAQVASIARTLGVDFGCMIVNLFFSNDHKHEFACLVMAQVYVLQIVTSVWPCIIFGVQYGVLSGEWVSCLSLWLCSRANDNCIAIKRRCCQDVKRSFRGALKLAEYQAACKSYPALRARKIVSMVVEMAWMSVSLRGRL